RNSHRLPYTTLFRSGKGVFNADLESYYVVDDFSDHEYLIDPQLRRAYSAYGVFDPDPSDSTKGGLGLQVNVRILQWANILAEDAMFLIYRITNKGTTNYGEVVSLPQGLSKTGLYFAQFVDYGLGNEEGDENAAFDPLLDIRSEEHTSELQSRENLVSRLLPAKNK